MVASGIKEESAYYESLHELPLIANTVARKKLYEMNRIISDTAEYGCYLFDHAAKPLLVDFMKKIDTSVIGKSFSSSNEVDNLALIKVNEYCSKSSYRKNRKNIKSIHDGDESNKIKKKKKKL